MKRPYIEAAYDFSVCDIPEQLGVTEYEEAILTDNPNSSQATRPDTAIEFILGIGYTEDDYELIARKSIGNHSLRALAIIALTGEPRIMGVLKDNLHALDGDDYAIDLLIDDRGKQTQAFKGMYL